MQYTFADCTLDTQLYTLQRAGHCQQLRPKVFQVLLYLVKNRHRVVSKQELLEHVWPEHFISEATLENCLKEVRQVLGDSGRAQRLIQTLRGYGYRFVAAVEARAEAPLAETPALLACSVPQPVPGATPMRPIPLPPERAAGERKIVTILCCGLGETPALHGAARLDVLHSLLRTVHAVVQGEVDRYGGTVQHVASEHMLAVFGAPVAHEDHATRAVLAALGIQHRARCTTRVGVTRRRRTRLSSPVWPIALSSRLCRHEYTGCGHFFTMPCIAVCGINAFATPPRPGTHTVSRGEEYEMFGPRTHSHHRLIEGDQLQSIHSRQIQKRGVRYLSVADDFWYQCVEQRCSKGWSGFCILMMRMGNETVKQVDSGLAINRYANHLRIQREAEKARLRQQAGRPSRGRVTRKPAMRRVVMCMVAPRQGE
jgi:DNA-binding winged helix-turn-helix (wHTH) protein